MRSYDSSEAIGEERPKKASPSPYKERSSPERESPNGREMNASIANKRPKERIKKHPSIKLTSMEVSPNDKKHGLSRSAFKVKSRVLNELNIENVPEVSIRK